MHPYRRRSDRAGEGGADGVRPRPCEPDRDPAQAAGLRRCPFTDTHACAAGVPVPASSYEATVNVAVAPGSRLRDVALRPSVGSVAPVFGSNVVQ